MEARKRMVMEVVLVMMITTRMRRKRTWAHVITTLTDPILTPVSVPSFSSVLAARHTR